MSDSILLSHDYLVQKGGAERVVAGWAQEWPNATIRTLAYDPDATHDLFRKSTIMARLGTRPSHAMLAAMLPVLPMIARRVSLVSADIELVSSSGWAHQFPGTAPRYIYWHSPARWLYAAQDYRLGLNQAERLALSAVRRFLLQRDRAGLRATDVHISNSAVTQARVKAAYGVDSDIVHPPVLPLLVTPKMPEQRLPDLFLLIIARARGYKNVGLAAAAAASAGVPLVVAGAGTEVWHAPENGMYGLGEVSDAELRWLYRNAVALLATGREDFGLTALEANFEGTPTVGVPRGGYLETIREGVNGFLATEETAEELALAISKVSGLERDEAVSWAQQFRLQAHLERLRAVIDAKGSRKQ